MHEDSLCVVFVSNKEKQVPIFHQTSGIPEHRGLAVWDYHVFVLQVSRNGTPQRLQFVGALRHFPNTLCWFS